MVATSRSRLPLDPPAVLALRHLEWRVRAVMEGVRIGLHRSPFSGSSVEFSEYRPYTSGDDVRHLDWRVLARTDRHYLRRHEAETNLRAWLVFDASRSMEFGSRPGVTKAAYARTLVGTLAWFLHDQRDLPGLARFDGRLQEVIPPSARVGQLRRILAALEAPADGRETDLAATLRHLARLTRRRSVIVLVSDFLTPVAPWAGGLRELAAAGHAVRALQVLDPAEPALEHLTRAALWEDLESGQRRYVDPARAAPRYAERFAQHRAELQQTLEQAGVPLQVVPTTTPFDQALLQFLRHRPPAIRRRAAR